MNQTLVCAFVLLGTTLAFGQSTMKMKMSKGINEFGGPIYNGSPALEVTASLVKAGGGSANFSIGTALDSMVGTSVANGELKKLTRQYGKTRVDRFVKVFNFAVIDALKMATDAGVTLPTATMGGKELAGTLVKAGMDMKGTFWTGYLLDKALTHKIHMAVMDDIDRKWSPSADRDYHRISNQAHYDLGKAFMIPHVKLASLH